MAQIRDIVMPKLGLTMTEGILAEWKVEPGSIVCAGDPIFVVETEKVANEVEAQHDGIVDALLVNVGETVSVGTPVARLRETNGTSSVVSMLQASESPGLTPPVQAHAMTERDAPVSLSATSRQASPVGRVIATPFARRLARRGGIDLSTVLGSGPRGRIKATDVQTALSAKQPQTIQAPVYAAYEPQEAACVTQLLADISVCRIVALQTELAAASPGLNIPLSAFLVAAAARSLRKMPHLNATSTEGHPEPLSRIDIRVALRTGQSFRTSVVAEADRRKLSEISQDMARPEAENDPAAQDAPRSPVTIYDMGAPSLRFFAPYLEPGQSLAIGIGAIARTYSPGPNGESMLRHTVGFSLTAHRRISPDDAVRFAEIIVGHLEQPMGMLA